MKQKVKQARKAHVRCLAHNWHVCVLSISMPSGTIMTKMMKETMVSGFI